MTHEVYCSYELAVSLKAAGFDWECMFYYDKEDAPNGEVWFTNLSVACNHNGCNNPRICSAPTLAVAAKWLREVKGVALNIIAHDGDEYHYSEVFLSNFQERDYKYYEYREHPLVGSYEEALSMGLTEMLKLLNDN
ncbi:MAG: hypothetical protein NC548_36920 [Lachnospiraceae bacterium]|nr:hypothetical protein [Lachnospiraceae bacterium]